MPIWLSEADVRAVLPLRDLIETMARALAAFSCGEVRQPVRTVFEAGLPGSFFGTMPAFLEAGPVMGAKLVTVFPQNARVGLPTHQAVVVLFDAKTGALEAVMDGRYITEVRTAAASAVALRTLSRPETNTLAIVGSGVQAASHLHALSMVRTFTEVRCWSPTEANLRQFAAAHPQVRVASNAEAAVRGAGVVVIATSSVVPVVESEWVSQGACVISVGACRPTQREMDPRLVARGRLIVDTRAAALKESGDIVIAMSEGHFGPEHIAAELGEVVAGHAPGRTSDEEVTIYKPLGMAVEDVAAAQLAYTRARAAGRGVDIGSAGPGGHPLVAGQMPA